MVFESIVTTMMEMDVFHLFLPWLLVLTVTYGILQKEEIFREETITATASLAISFLAIGGFYLFVPAELFGHFAAVIGFVIFGLIGLIVLLAVVGFSIDDLDSGSRNLPAIAVAGVTVLALIGVLIYQFDLLSLLSLDVLEISGMDINFDEHIMPILVLAFLLAIIVFLSRGG